MGGKKKGVPRDHNKKKPTEKKTLLPIKKRGPGKRLKKKTGWIGDTLRVLRTEGQPKGRTGGTREINLRYQAGG